MESEDNGSTEAGRDIPEEAEDKVDEKAEDKAEEAEDNGHDGPDEAHSAEADSEPEPWIVNPKYKTRNNLQRD
jgi:hypothetical protein